MDTLYVVPRPDVAVVSTRTLEQAYSNNNVASTASLNGQITASFAAFDRTVDDYDTMARREIVDEKREKAVARVARFREDYQSLRKQYERIKTSGAQQKATADRDSLLGVPTGSASGVSSSFSATGATPRLGRTASSQGFSSDSPFSINMSASASTQNGDGSGRWQPNNPPGFDIRTNRALDENDRLGGIGSSLDSFLAQGQAVMGNLASQRDMLKDYLITRRLLSAANTLGLSRETITFIERRTKADYYILIGGGIFTLVCFYYILRFFGGSSSKKAAVAAAKKAAAAAAAAAKTAQAA
ncbi:protein transport protein bos1 [Microbotryomycetes sp. JL221]|nr:protein transport protein bos1 [Microbotryomycetes sp. JL221]